jgi:hypothetical protein
MLIGETTSSILGFAVWINISKTAQLDCSKYPKLYTNEQLRDIFLMNSRNQISQVRNTVFGKLWK